MPLLFSPLGGIVFQLAVSVGCYVGFCAASIFDEEIRSDMEAINWNPFNEIEKSALNASKVSFYKGAPVLRTSVMEGSMSLGLIFLDKDHGNAVLKHERGHNTQLMSMGLGNFLIQIAIPSVWKNETEAPWELSASMLGDSAFVDICSDEQKKESFNYYIRSFLPVINIYNIFQYVSY